MTDDGKQERDRADLQASRPRRSHRVSAVALRAPAEAEPGVGGAPQRLGAHGAARPGVPERRPQRPREVHERVRRNLRCGIFRSGRGRGRGARDCGEPGPQQVGCGVVVIGARQAEVVGARDGELQILGVAQHRRGLAASREGERGAHEGIRAQPVQRQRRGRAARGLGRGEQDVDWKEDVHRVASRREPRSVDAEADAGVGPKDAPRFADGVGDRTRHSTEGRGRSLSSLLAVASRRHRGVSESECPSDCPRHACLVCGQRAEALGVRRAGRRGEGAPYGDASNVFVVGGHTGHRQHRPSPPQCSRLFRLTMRWIGVPACGEGSRITPSVLFLSQPFPPHTSCALSRPRAQV